MEFFARVFWFVLLVVLPISLLRSCYLNLNLCGRSDNIELLTEKITHQMTQHFQDYMFLREMKFDQLYQAKLHQMCLDEMTVTGQAECSDQSDRLDIHEERKKFTQSLQQGLVAPLKPSETPFYLQYLQDQRSFIANPQYEKLMVDFNHRVEKMEQDFIRKYPDRYQDVAYDEELARGVKLLFVQFMNEIFKLKVQDVDSIDRWWRTFFSDEKSCRADVLINPKMYPDLTHQILFTSHQRTHGNQDIDPMYDYITFGVNITGVQTSTQLLSTADTQADYFSQYLVMPKTMQDNKMDD